MASAKSSGPGSGPPAASREERRRLAIERATERLAEKATRQAIERATDKIAEKATRQAERARAKAERHAEALDRLAAHLDALDVWIRAEPGSRRPRYRREEIAAMAVQIADAEGFDAVSMRRLAAELGAGTMTLYHYVRTKDELLALIVDTVMAEIVLPADQPLPPDWREATSIIARRTRDALRRHPWILDIADDPAIGPNSVRHFDQTMQALAPLDLDLAAKLDIIHAIDEYVFGFCLHERTTLHEDAASGDEMMAYVAELLADGSYPELARLVEREGLAQLWTQILSNAHDPERFDRNLARLLNGIAGDFQSR